MATSVSSSHIRIGQGSVVCNDSLLKGTIAIGSGTVIHPKANILGEGGSIVIGENNIIEEQCVIKHSVDLDGQDRPRTMMVGSNNVFEVGCIIMAKSIGDNNVFEAKSFVGPEIEVGNGCIIGAGISLKLKEKLPDNVIITGSNYSRTIAADRPPPQHLQLDFLSKVLPNYHHLRKTKERPSNL